MIDDLLMIPEEVILQYLQDNPQFLSKYQHLLAPITPPEQQDGTASLIHHQFNHLRAKQYELEEEITAMMVAAQENERIFQSNNQIVLSLLKLKRRAELLPTLKEELSKHFGVRYISLLPTANNVSLKALMRRRFFGSSYQGCVTEHESRLLFNKPVGSVALLYIAGESQSYILALGHDNPTHFEQEKGDIFLQQLKALFSVKWFSMEQ